MDPITALSLAGNIITFIEFSAELLSNAHAISSSATGTLAENDDIERVTEDLRLMMESLLSHQGPGTPINDDIKALLSLARECRKLCSQLLAMVSKLKARGPSKSQSFRTAIRALMKKGELETMQRRVARYQTQIRDRVATMLRYVVLEAFHFGH